MSYVAQVFAVSLHLSILLHSAVFEPQQQFLRVAMLRPNGIGIFS